MYHTNELLTLSPFPVLELKPIEQILEKESPVTYEKIRFGDLNQDEKFVFNHEALIKTGEYTAIHDRSCNKQMFLFNKSNLVSRKKTQNLDEYEVSVGDQIRIYWKSLSECDDMTVDGFLKSQNDQEKLIFHDKVINPSFDDGVIFWRIKIPNLFISGNTMSDCSLSIFQNSVFLKTDSYSKSFNSTFTPGDSITIVLI